MSPSVTTISRRDYDAVIFDLDGVVTDTASAHTAAWKETFDEFLRHRLGEDFQPFTERDYRRWVDGKPRFDGIRSFLSSRDIELPEGNDDDPPGLDTVQGLGHYKNRRYHRHLKRGEIDIFDETVDFIRQLHEHNFRVGLVSSSRNARRVLEITELDSLFEVRVDGTTLAELGLAGKPAPDMFVEAARRLDARPPRCVVVEDAESGVQAGESGQFGLVIGLTERESDQRRLEEAGADVAVESMARFEVA